MSDNGSAYVSHVYGQYLERYNFKRPHGSLRHQPPATRLTNLVRNYI